MGKEIFKQPASLHRIYSDRSPPKLTLDTMRDIMTHAGLIKSRKRPISKKKKTKRRANRRAKKAKIKKRKLLMDLPKLKQQEMDQEQVEKLRAIENGSYVSTLKPFDPSLLHFEQKKRILSKLRRMLSFGEIIQRTNESFSSSSNHSLALKWLLARQEANVRRFKATCLKIEKELLDLELYIENPREFMNRLY